jgi:hypothetical protein
MLTLCTTRFRSLSSLDAASARLTSGLTKKLDQLYIHVYYVAIGPRTDIRIHMHRIYVRSHVMRQWMHVCAETVQESVQFVELLHITSMC